MVIQLILCNSAMEIIVTPLIGGGIKRFFCLTSDVCLRSVCLSICLSVAYIGPNA